MAITAKSIKILWSAAAGLCSFADCRERLTFSEAGAFAPHILGEMAHICGDRPGANRHDESQPPEERDDYRNLILLCPTHHRLIDRPENENRFPVGLLQQMKADHEAYVRSRIENTPVKDASAIAAEIAPMLAENYTVWQKYGPHSEIARRNPHSEAAHSVWLSERLSTIVPNNRRIGAMLQAGARAFPLDVQPVIAEFQLHQRSYERWVSDEISYEGVTRFPQEFASLIEETIRARY
jgi:hypothetical protein